MPDLSNKNMKIPYSHLLVDVNYLNIQFCNSYFNKSKYMPFVL